VPIRHPGGELEMTDCSGYWPGDPLPPYIHRDGINFVYDKAQDAYVAEAIHPRPQMVNTVGYVEQTAAGMILWGVVLGLIGASFLAWVPALILGGLVALLFHGVPAGLFIGWPLGWVFFFVWIVRKSVRASRDFKNGAYR